MIVEFVNDDPAYLHWISENPDGYVLNVRAREDPNYVVLHRATCWTISRPAEPGAYTGRTYRKICSLHVDELRAAARAHGRADETFSKHCGKCEPQ